MNKRIGLGLIVVGLACCIVGIAEKQTTDAEQSEYCEMVKQKLWPDFHHSFRSECNTKK
jgi:hypothetical protein